MKNSAEHTTPHDDMPVKHEEVRAAERVHDLCSVLDKQIEQPARNDPYIRAYALGVRAALGAEGPIAEFLYETLKRRPQFEGSYLINKVRSALQDHLYFPGERPGSEHEPTRHRVLLHRDGEPLQYPQDYISPDIWTAAFEEVLADPDVFSEFLIDVWTRPLASNVSERYKGVKIIAAEAHNVGRLDDITLADIGCSQQAGGNHLMSGAPFERIVAIRKGSRTIPNVGQTRTINRIMNEPTPFTQVLGTDLYYPQEARSWARSCSHYPLDLTHPERVNLYDNLIMDPQENVFFYRSDFTDFDHKKFVYNQEAAGRPIRYNIVNFTTMLYQATPEERDVMLANARAIAKEFIIVQDFVGIDRNDPSQLLFRKDWQDTPFPYRTLILDLREETPVWREIFRWSDGRCREMVVGMGRTALRNGLRDSLWTPSDDPRRW